MWMFTPFGILMPAIRPPRTVAANDPHTLQIRARREKDLDILRAKYMTNSLGATIYTPDKDYEYRAYCTPEAFAVAAMQMILEIDYLKFKPTTEDRFRDKELHSTYNSVWGAVLRNLSTKAHQDQMLPPIKPYTGGNGVNLAKPVTVNGTVFGAGTSTSTVESYGTSDPILADLWREYDAVEYELNQDWPLKHDQCDHGASDNARSRCRTRYRRGLAEKLALLSQEIDQRYDHVYGIPSVTNGVAQSDAPVTVGAVSTTSSAQNN